ncbi:ABC transporter permease protein [Fulvivirga imtechensis AK7]|uniref:ABC transporter permease protein n=1 Tax=Fulvivirga imtechensis AK7 TaxID=1237149 RepID=L8JWZ3_9BACT|nr:ABC transporter permease [Fulvivirga imtechensis]ELR73290.1 ABC transporter permease protein [Fulvivirga imtechensis AK7]
MKIAESLPESFQRFFINVAGIGRFTKQFFRQVFKPPFEFREILNQAYRLGYDSLFLVGITGFIIGMVMTLQTKPTLEQFGAESWLPSMVSVSIIREIGPVLTALICAGKVGSGIGAELGSMKVSEQIDAMTVSGANAFNYLVVTRVIATTITVPILVYYADAISLVGSYVGVNIEGNVSPSLFYKQSLDILVFSDIVPATIKTLFFGFAIGIVGCYKGATADKGTLGVGSAANSAVVISSLMIFVIDLIAVQLTQLFIR